MLNAFGGHSFGKGLYRLHGIEDIEAWNTRITEAFPAYRGRIQVFGFDWLGRQFTLDKENENNGQCQILTFEPGTGQVLEIPCNFMEFHNDEIPNYPDACLASGFFNDWLSVHPSAINHEQCVGYKTMLFLGGSDDIENLEVSNNH